VIAVHPGSRNAPFASVEHNPGRQVLQHRPRSAGPSKTETCAPQRLSAGEGQGTQKSHNAQPPAIEVWWNLIKLWLGPDSCVSSGVIGTTNRSV
jgi:hypothetical protein